MTKVYDIGGGKCERGGLAKAACSEVASATPNEARGALSVEAGTRGWGWQRQRLGIERWQRQPAAIGCGGLVSTDTPNYMETLDVLESNTLLQQ